MREPDVVVVGAGIVGCATAYFLARRGLRVTICEAGTAASGATGLSSGGVRSQFGTALETRMTLRTRRLWSAFEREHDVDLDYCRVGYLTLATDDATADELARRRAMQRELGVTALELGSAGLAALVPGLNTDDVRIAIYTPEDGFGSPADVTTRVLAQARRAGASLRQHTRVQCVTVGGRRKVTVQLGDGDSLTCGAIVNCAGLGAPELGADVGLQLPVSAYRQHQFLTEPVDDLDVAKLPNVLDPGLDLYLRGEGRSVLLGIADASEAGRADTAVTWALLEPLAERLEHRWPRLANLGVAKGWVGCYEVTPDRRALIGGSDGYFYAAGFSGHGFMHGFAAGETVAALVAQETPPLDVRELSADRFSAAGLAS